MDSSGFRMGSELSEKVTEINTNFFDSELDIRVRRIGLTPEQVIEHHIPLVDRKITEKANQGLYKAYVTSQGLDPTKKAELDALGRYYPGGVAAFVESWLSKFYDSNLEDRCASVTQEFIQSLPAKPELPENVVELRTKILSSLEDLISIEDKIEVPSGDSIKVDIEPQTEDPAGESWLLSTRDSIYPQEGDVDVVSERMV